MGVFVAARTHEVSMYMVPVWVALVLPADFLTSLFESSPCFAFISAFPKPLLVLLFTSSALESVHHSYAAAFLVSYSLSMKS